MFNLSTLFSDPIVFVVGFVALVISIGWHEFSHVLSAYLQGDQTGKMMGRLTMNPIRHLDPLGTLMIVAIGLGWGKPAPFNPYNLRFRRWGSALVAIAGPISNLLIVAVAGYILLLVGPNLPTGNLLLVFLQTLVILNAALAIFNLIPISPLDGSHLLEAIAPNQPVIQWLHRYGAYMLLALIILPNSILGTFIMGGVRLILTALGLHALL